MKVFINKKPFFYLKIILTATILWALIHSTQLKLGLFSTLFHHPFYTLTIIMLCYLMVVLHAWRWFRLNTALNIQLAFQHTIAPTYIGIAFNTVLPGSIGGDFFRLFYVIKKFPEQKSAAILSILVDRIVGLMGIFAIACTTLPYYLKIFQGNSTLFDLLILCITFCMLSIAFVLIICLILSERIGLDKWLIAQFASTRWASMLDSFIKAVHSYQRSKLIILESLLVSMLTQWLLLIVILMLNHIMGLPRLPPFDYMLALVIAQIANLLPVTPGGIGIGEAAFANVLLIINPGISAAYATIFFALRLLSSTAYIPGVFLGIFGFNILQKTNQNLKIHAKTGIQ